jgi:AraC-like DNA-binding protein
MSVRTLDARFAAEVGHTVGDELRRVRLQQAKALLQRTDGAYFARFFRKHTGQTPSAFRRQS